MVELKANDISRQLVQVEQMNLPAEINDGDAEREEDETAAARASLNNCGERVGGEAQVAVEGNVEDLRPLKLRKSGKWPGRRLLADASGSGEKNQEEHRGKYPAKTCAAAAAGFDRHERSYMTIAEERTIYAPPPLPLSPGHRPSGAAIYDLYLASRDSWSGDVACSIPEGGVAYPLAA